MFYNKGGINTGLDMYLEGEKYVGFDDEIKVIVEPDILKGYKIKELVVELIYWRKANQIHRWFVTNVQKGVDDCGRYYVSEECLQKLYTLVCEVLEEHDKAKTLLPSHPGFFFGSTNYDKYYYRDLEETKTSLEKLFASEILKTFSVYYHSSW